MPSTHTLCASAQTPSRLAWADIVQSLILWRRWLYLANVDIAARYRRSVIGPFWITLTNAFMLTCIGFTFSRLWQGNAEGYMSYFGVSYLVWNMISTLISEATDTYIEAAPFIQNYQTNKMLWVLRIVCRNLIILGHMVPIYIVLALLYPLFKTEAFLYFFAALPLFIVQCIWMTAITAALSTRFRDVKRLVGLIIYLVFLVTPIIWKVETLKSQSWVYELNPMYYVIELFRNPLLGKFSSPLVWEVNIALAFVGCALAFFLHRFTVRRLFYWL